MFGINVNSVLPMRSEPREQSEMCSQLLFGETFEITDETENWYFVYATGDNYSGWVDKKMTLLISDSEMAELLKDERAIVNKPIASCFIRTQNENIILSGGSVLHNYNAEKESFSINNTTYHIAKELVNMGYNRPITGDELLTAAFMYLNTPYLWGGKNALGMDCSGFVQVVFRICGKLLPRDCSEQVEIGRHISFLQEAQSGDIAFFENKEGAITHVGILINNTHVVHASGRVKIEAIDNEGIISETTGNYTHRLRVIKRVL
jgi:gamma-D-glutamyl-L-lysine dipeptidyl-peptidase